MSEQTAGQSLTAELRRYFSVGSRTRQNRDPIYGPLRGQMIEAVMQAAMMPGYYSERTEKALRTGFAVALGYNKHVVGCRISGTKIAAIKAMSPYCFAAFLGEMVDAGITCTGDSEDFFAKWEAA